MPVYSFEECVTKATSRLSGSAGPCGVKAEMLKNWLLCHGDQFECLREAMSTWWTGSAMGRPHMLPTMQ